MRILVAQGIGDSLWVCVKAQGIANLYGDGKVELLVACWYTDRDAESRALDVLRRIPWVDSVDLYVMPRDRPGAVLKPGSAAENGIYRYIDDGPPSDLPGVDFVAVANRAVDRGVRIEDWLPEVPSNWTFLDDLRIDAHERMWADAFHRTTGDYVVFFCASEECNGPCPSGWNRGPLWTAGQWADLGRRISMALDVDIVVIGADWDLTYWQKSMSPIVGYEPRWHSLVGRLTMGETLAVLQRSRAVISFPCGIGVMSHYLRRPTCMFFRRHGDPIDLTNGGSPDDGIATAWTYPDTGDEYLPAWYGETTVDQIVQHTIKGGW